MTIPCQQSHCYSVQTTAMRLGKVEGSIWSHCVDDHILGGTVQSITVNLYSKGSFSDAGEREPQFKEAVSGS